jgi:hypothetical protein
MAFTNANVSMQLISTITVANITTGSLGYSNLNVAGSPMNSAVAWSSTTIAQSVNGNVTQSGAVSNLPTPSRLVIGNGFTGIVALGGYFRKLTYWPRTMSNTELQQATTP